MPQSMNLVKTFDGGYLKDEIKSVVLVNNTAKTLDFSCPTGKLWKILSIRLTNPDNVDRIVTVDAYYEAACTNKIARLFNETLPSTKEVTLPTSKAPTLFDTYGWIGQPFLLNVAETIRVVWAAGGVSAGATDADGLVFHYLEIVD